MITYWIQLLLSQVSVIAFEVKKIVGRRCEEKKLSYFRPSGASLILGYMYRGMCNYKLCICVWIIGLRRGLRKLWRGGTGGCFFVLQARHEKSRHVHHPLSRPHKPLVPLRSSSSFAKCDIRWKSKETRGEVLYSAPAPAAVTNRTERRMRYKMYYYCVNAAFR